MEQITLTLLSAERQVVASVSASSITLTGSEGQIQVLPGHAHMIGTLETGSFQFTPVNGTPVVGVISTGFFEVTDDHIKVLAETVELASEIDLERAKRAQQRAEAALQKAEMDDHQFKKYQLKLQRALIRQQIASQTTH